MSLSNNHLKKKSPLFLSGNFKAVSITLALTILAWWIHQLPFPPFTLENGHLKHPIGVSAMSILLGITAANLFSNLNIGAGCRWITTWSIPIAIMFLGLRMNLALLGQIGWPLLLATIFIMLLAVGVTYGIGRFFGMNPRAASLLGIGTSVCGSSAILAVAPVAEADDEDVVVTIGVVNLVGLIAMFSSISLLWFMSIDAKVYGAWVGATIHAVPQVVAAAESHSLDAAALGTLVKLTRVTMLAPIVLLTAFVTAKHPRTSNTSPSSISKQKRKIWQYVPWFIWGFIGFATLKALGWVPDIVIHSGEKTSFTISLDQVLPTTAKYLLAFSMTAIGLQVHLKSMLKAGGKAFIAGIISWLLISGVSLGLFFFLIG